MRKSRSILEELNSISVDRSKDYVVENRGEHVINSAINLIEQLESNYDEKIRLRKCQINAWDQIIF